MDFDIQEIASATGAEIIGNQTPSTVSRIIFDSRSLQFPHSTLFVALLSKAADGHRHLAELAVRGVKYFLVEQVPQWAAEAPDCCFLRVADTFEALEQLAVVARSRINGTVVAITGSQGKTVVKEMMYALEPGKVWRNPRSWNSRLGVPMSLIEADENAPVCVFEAGIDRPGDMEHLARLLRPEVGVFTGLTEEHDNGFTDSLEKIHEKFLLFKGVRALVYNSVNPVIREFAEQCNVKDRVAVENSDIAVLDTQLAVQALNMCGISVELPSQPLPMVSNRLDVHEGVNDCTIVFDGFTNDLRSLEALLDFMRRRSLSHLTSTVILGDIFAGDISRLPGILEAFGVSRVVAVSKELLEALENSSHTFSVEGVESAREFLNLYDINRFSSENILIAGGATKDFAKIKHLLISARHNTIFEINLDAIVHNFNEYRKCVEPSTGMVAMVKASAYGLGSVEISRTLQAQGATYLAVAVIDEGVELRRGGITMPVMVLNPVTTNYRALFNNNLEPSVFSIGELEMLVKEARKAGVKKFRAHIKLDTGMHRVGFTESEIPNLLKSLDKAPELEVASVFSHLATADCPDQNEYTDYQLANFKRMSDAIVNHVDYPVKRHILNTAGIETHPEHRYDMVRLGIGLYGVDPLPASAMDLRPVATLKTTVISLKKWPAGTTIGYGRRGVLKRASTIATVPIGYADGLDRHLSCGALSVIVRGVKCPTVGNICMDQCMIDVTDVPGVVLGDEVEIFGSGNRVEHIAEILGTIPYEILTSVSPRVKRIYYRD